MSSILKTFLALVAVITVVWRVDAYNGTKYASNDAVQQLAETMNSYITNQRLDTIIGQIWELNHSGIALSEKEYKELDKLKIEKGLLIKKLEGLTK